MTEKREKREETVKQDYILLIMNCERYKEKALIQKKGWLRNIPSYIHFYHVIGNPGLIVDNEYLFAEEDNILYVKTEDDYNSLPKKVIAAYSAVHEKFEYKYIFKTDDDQDLSNFKFFDMVCGFTQKMVPTVHYGGYIIDVKRPYLSQYNKIHPELPAELPILPIQYCNGRFYFL